MVMCVPMIVVNRAVAIIPTTPLPVMTAFSVMVMTPAVTVSASTPETPVTGEQNVIISAMKRLITVSTLREQPAVTPLIQNVLTPILATELVCACLTTLQWVLPAVINQTPIAPILIPATT